MKRFKDFTKSGGIHLIDTNGCEFGYEMIQCVPHAYYRHLQGENVVVLTSKNMEEFYYFLHPSQVYTKYQSREFNYPDGTELNDIHWDNFDPKQWVGPNYSEYYKDYDLDLLGFLYHKHLFDKPLMFISNKYTQEWLNPPVNFLNLELLDKLFSRFKDTYTIFYNRPRPESVPQDRAQEHYPFGDWNLIKDKHPEVIDLNNFKRDNYNKLQIVLASKTKKFISVQGGTSILSSMFGGENIVFARKGEELKRSSFSWYNRFAGTKVTNFNDYNKLYDKVDKEW